MVLKKQTYNGGFHGLLAPVIPKAPRSLRRRSLPKKPSENGDRCAFELLAAAADKLLQEQESESSTSSTVPEEGVKDEPLEVKIEVKPTNLVPLKEELPHPENDSGSDHASVVTNADLRKEADPDSILDAAEDKSSNLCNGMKNRLEPRVNTREANQTSRSVRLSFYHDPFHGSCFPGSGNANVNIRDDDEKYFRYNNRINTRLSSFGSRSCAGYKRMRKMMRSRYWKVARKMKDYELPNGSSGVKSFFHKRKNIFKRRKMSHQNSRNSHIKKAGRDILSNLVKFSIKSFKVPELYIEVPETATVGSLKKSVMEAVQAMVHGNLHVGVLVQGKKVRDDNRTLRQSGISQLCNLETLGFTLEPSLPEASSFLVEQESPCNMQQQQRSRLPSSPHTDGGFSTSSPDPLTDMEVYVEKNEEGTPLAAELTTKEPVEDSKALVLVPPLDAEVLAAVPLTEKPTKRYECSQRRIRRPFSVSEVEALVEAVETLGAGRWRDVKMRAFNDADHRTYVDLKDKWKTLVHTASIAPQQRRGEPVPQELLDRVLAAHAYWSQHQHVKKQQKASEAQM